MIVKDIHDGMIKLRGLCMVQEYSAIHMVQEYSAIQQLRNLFPL